MGENPSPLGEDFSMLTVWKPIVGQATVSMISNIT